MTAIQLQIGGMGCAACALQIEDALRPLPGLAGVRVDPATAEARIEFEDLPDAGIESILREIRKLGFSASVAGSVAASSERTRARRAALKRLAVSGFGMMQVMMLAFALYSSDEFRMDPALVNFLRYCSLLVTLPVTMYAGAPIFAAALAQLRARRPAMDVPVGLGIGAALLASIWNTFAGAGEVYFDAVTMFLFFITAARFIEMSSRHDVGTVTEALAWLLPARVLRLTQGRTSLVPVGSLKPDDEILVNQGDPVAADGVIVAGESVFNEACLTGEAAPVPRQVGARVISGSINLGPGVQVRVTAAGEQTELAAVLRLLERSRQAKPALLSLADRMARNFSVALLAFATAVSVLWLLLRPEVALANTVAVLVVACPCALSLAAPAVIACANSALARLGLLPISATALEQLATVRHVLLDKTGTLTTGRPDVAVHAVRAGAGEASLLGIAAALERGSSHPLASAFRGHEQPAVQAGLVREIAGQGIAGRIDGRDYRLGRREFVTADAVRVDGVDDGLFLGDDDGLLARFDLKETVRPDAREAVDALRRLQLDVEIASGDAPGPVRRVAQSLGIARWQARLSPAAKVARLEALQAAGTPVLMVGDGINDAPVLAAADVSMVLRSGSALAQTAGDLLLLDGAWRAVPAAVVVARRARQVLKQNLVWAAAYNLTGIPLAALGWLPPWLAALGMSLSSVLVVLNARRVRA
ncbi:MAG: cadmium-translocating P-type ATPase [Chromatiales bacterium]|nr:MAG: cadmium-translocating P-type ATPase [Chromatiales bacterium]